MFSSRTGLFGWTGRSDPMRHIVQSEEWGFPVWGCSDCSWLFNASGPPIGQDIPEMEQNYYTERDKQFREHLCSDYGKPGDPSHSVPN